VTIIQTAELGRQYPPADQLQIYNGLDCMVTLEVLDAIRPQLAARPDASGIYAFERALQAPYLEIMQRGFRVNQGARLEAAQELRAKREFLEGLLNELAIGVWGRELNARSPAQLNEFFYRALRMPEQWISQKGQKRLSSNREALEKLDAYMHARPFVATILAIRDIGKQLDVFEGDIDQEGSVFRFRAAYNIAGTETGRPSSSTNAFGTGGNAQNIAPGLRYVFEADPGYKMVSIDLEQVEARDVGFIEGCLFNNWKFLDACESGDLHTNNAKLVWPELPWPGDAKGDKAVAERQFYREFTYRDMAKRGSHLSNYSGTAWTMARALKIPQPVAEEFQARYCRGPRCAFPAHAQWWQWTATQLQTLREITTPFGRTRQFFGRPGDDTTLREAIAFLPQSMTADRMNLGLWRTWRREPGVQLLAQTYDSITFQVLDDERVDETIGRVLEHLAVELRSPSDRRYVVPAEAKLGWNWGNAWTAEDNAKLAAKSLPPRRLNPEGLVKWKPGADKRRRLLGVKQLAIGGR
jgi:DNA polymerase I-like protein with 3'-5' exonuclease and polymerase domains